MRHLGDFRDFIKIIRDYLNKRKGDILD